MSANKSYLLGDVELRLDEIKSLKQYFENVLTYNAKRELVAKKGEDGKELKKLKLNFSILKKATTDKMFLLQFHKQRNKEIMEKRKDMLPMVKFTMHQTTYNLLFKSQKQRQRKQHQLQQMICHFKL